MNYPRITVVTPSYNQGLYIEETILSVLNQDYPNLEYIVIDGGSTDNSPQIIQKYADKIDHFVSEPDNGQTHAINKGFKLASGDIVCWLNSDDVFLPGTLKIVAQSFQDNKVEIVMGWTLRIDEKSNILFNHFIPKQTLWMARRGVFYFGQQSWFWRREMFEYLGYLDEECHACMDIEFFMRQLMSKPKIKHLPMVMSGFRIHGNTKTSVNGRIWSNDRNRLARKYRFLNYQNASAFARSVYGVHKLLMLYYIRQALFKRRWAGKALEAFINSKV